MTLSIRKYDKKNTITFKSTKGKFGGLSNMAPNFPVYIDNIKINNIELLYQALKFPDYPYLQYDIISLKNPMLGKKLSREYNHLARPDWFTIRFSVMKFCLSLKYLYNKRLFGLLLKSTNGHLIAEFTYNDKVWGVTDDGEYYEGTNALGRLLMELRENINDNNFVMTVPNIYNLKLLNKDLRQIIFESK